jgi:hypothetical protein
MAQVAFFSQRRSRLCPVCGAELPLDDEFLAPCEHLIADWPDGSDGDDGILGESCRTKAALDKLPALFSAFSCLVNLAAGRDEEADATEDSDERSLDEDGLAALKRRLSLSSDSTPIWYQPLDECLSDVSRPNYIYADELVSAALKECPGVCVTVADLGGPMVSTSVTFVWAEDPPAAIACVDAKLVQMTGEINEAANRLRTQDSR